MFYFHYHLLHWFDLNIRVTCADKFEFKFFKISFWWPLGSMTIRVVNGLGRWPLVPVTSSCQHMHNRKSNWKSFWEEEIFEKREFLWRKRFIHSWNMEICLFVSVSWHMEALWRAQLWQVPARAVFLCYEKWCERMYATHEKSTKMKIWI